MLRRECALGLASLQSWNKATKTASVRLLNHGILGIAHVLYLRSLFSANHARFQQEARKQSVTRRTLLSAKVQRATLAPTYLCPTMWQHDLARKGQWQIYHRGLPQTGGSFAWQGCILHSIRHA